MKQLNQVYLKKPSKLAILIAVPTTETLVMSDFGSV